MNRLVLVIALLMLSTSQLYSQDQPTKRIRVKKGQQVILPDTIFITRRDTTLVLTERRAKRLRIRKNPSSIASMFYDSLEQRAASRRVSQDIFKAVIKKKGKRERLVNAIIVSESVFTQYEGLKIESISVKVVDILEGSVIDTLQKATTKVGIFLNKVHKDTRINIIRQNLLFRVGEKLDAYRMADNERVLRGFKPLRDARLYVVRDKKKKDAVHVTVVVQDVSAIGVAGTRNSWEDFRLDVFHVNLGGNANQLQVSYFRNTSYSPNNGYEILLRNPNLGGTFLQGQIQYADNFIHKDIAVSVGRDFFTPEIKYAGGATFYNTHEHIYIDQYDTMKLPYIENYYEIWGGRSFEIKKRTNLIVSALVNPRKFSNTPYNSADSNTFFHDRTLVLGNITLAKRNYMKSLRIRGFGRTEDIPIGAAAGVIFGREFNNFSDRYYSEINGSIARYFPKIGYLNVGFSTGAFINKGTFQDGQLSVSATAFSDLIRLRNTQMRQFVFFGLTKGISRVFDRSLLIEGGRWRDNVGHIPVGDQRLAVGLETDYFMPWYFYGFQFTLYYRGDIYLLANSSSLVDYQSIFYTVKAGVRTLNENLVLPSLSIELGYYGKSDKFPAAWQFKFTTTLPDLFASTLGFKPAVKAFQ
ncbi:MAG: hypothetical protein ABIS36_02725 [Chryseolinea sp.]